MTVESRAAIAGIGRTPLTRTPEHSETQLAVEAARAAIIDAGLSPTDIDGLSVQVHHYPPPDTEGVVRGLGLRDVPYQFTGEVGEIAGVASVGIAAEALKRGACKAIVITKVLNTIAPVMTPEIDPNTGAVAGNTQFEVPFGLGYTMQRVGLQMRRYLGRYGVTSEQIGWVAVVERENAIRTPWGYQKTPITLDDYLASRWIAEPVRLLDCDIPVNGAFAYVMTRADLAAGLRHRPVYVLSSVVSRAPAFEHLLPEGEGPMSPQAETLYRTAGRSSADVDLAYPYDGFSFWVPMWLETLGLVPRGEGGRFVEGGDRIRPSGELPVNTHGGNLSNGRMHGKGHILEAVEQLRGTAGARQVPKRAELAVLTAAGPVSGHLGLLSAVI